ncbi:MAG: SDR family NAD(P)-dependent oxidoreductase [Oscillospiraceae bacterium]|jgi:short-subunit dehydrogenase|nr:SDR family NAD(P)-dependent oxidoreductase [Oscillospiraceae bacterium]
MNEYCGQPNGRIIAVVTGASSGIGRDFARLLADGSARSAVDTPEEIWLIARREDRLETLAKELPIPARLIPLDLAAPDGVLRYEQMLRIENPRVRCLVNAAGYGRFAHTLDVPAETLLGMIDLNDRALTAMCVASLPYMDKGAAIVNIGSLSSFQPVPYINVYGASKAYVLSFSRTLNVELKSRGVRVICVCPGWVRTDFLDQAATDKNAVTYFNKLWEPRDVAARAFADLAKGKDVSILGFMVRAQVFLTKMLPHSLVMKIWMHQQGHT